MMQALLVAFLSSSHESRGFRALTFLTTRLDHATAWIVTWERCKVLCSEHDACRTHHINLLTSKTKVDVHANLFPFKLASPKLGIFCEHPLCSTVGFCVS
jgi:hypothetical protein